MKLTVKAIMHDAVEKEFTKDGKTYKYALGAFSVVDSSENTEDLLLCKISEPVFNCAKYGIVDTYVFDTLTDRIVGIRHI